MTTPTPLDLLPCPFCGNADEPIIAPWSNPNEAPGFMAVCTAASAHNGFGASTGWMPTEASAARVWNYRANATEIAQLRASLATAQAALKVRQAAIDEWVSAKDAFLSTGFQPDNAVYAASVRLDVAHAALTALATPAEKDAPGERT